MKTKNKQEAIVLKDAFEMRLLDSRKDKSVRGNYTIVALNECDRWETIGLYKYKKDAVADFDMLQGPDIAMQKLVDQAQELNMGY